MNWIDVFLFILASFLVSFLLVVLIYVIKKLFGDSDNE